MDWKWIKSQTILSYVTFLHFYVGLKVVYNMQRPTAQRVVSVEVLCSQCREPVYQSLNYTDTYNILINSYMGSGGNGFSMIKEKALSYKVGAVKDNEVLAEYVKTYSPVFKAIEGRILFVHSGMLNSRGDSLAVKVLFVVVLQFVLKCL